MQKFTCAIFGFLTLLLLVQELIPQVETARVRVARVRKGRHDKRQTQQHLLGFTDVPLDSNYDRRPRQQQQDRRPEDNPYNAGNRNVDYPTRNPNVNDDGRYNAQAQGSRKPQNKNSGEDCGGEDCDGNGIPGEAGVDYPIYAALPKTAFDCKRQEWPGYYADTDAKCQVFWICQKNKGDAFLCPNGTLFNQQLYVCDWWYNVDCAAAPDYYTRNQYIYAGPGIDLFGNQVTVKQSVSVSGGDTRRPVSQTPRPVASVGTSSSAQSTREILQAIESGAQGSGGNAYRREISHRDDAQGSYSTPSITGSSRTSSDASYQTSTYPSRETATNAPYETYLVREKPIPTTKRYNSEDLTYGIKRNQPTLAPQTNTAVLLSPSPSKSLGPRENQIQNPFIKQSTSPRAPETSSRLTTSVSASGPSAPLKPQQLRPQAHFGPPAPPQSHYTSSPSSAPSPAKHYTPPPPLQTKYNDNYAIAVKSSYTTTNAGAYLPTTTIRPSSSSSTNYNNPFIVQNNNYKANQYQTSSSRPNAGSENYYTTTRRTTPGFENDYESGFKFNFAKTYSPSASAPGGASSSNGPGAQGSAPVPYRSHYNGTLHKSTIFATTVKPNNANVYHHNPIPTIVQTTTRRPTPSTSYDGLMYAAKAIPQQFLMMKVSETPRPSTISSREVGTGAYSQRSGEVVDYFKNEYQTQKVIGQGQRPSQAQDDYYNYRQQQQQHHQAAVGVNYPASTKEKYATTTVSNNNFQGDKIVAKYNTMTSYNEGDDENYVELLRSLSRLGKETATLAPVVQVYHRYDPETSATIASPVAVHTYDFTATTTSAPRPIAYETTATTTASPTFGKKIKTGRKRNTSNWQNYFFKTSKS